MNVQEEIVRAFVEEINPNCAVSSLKKNNFTRNLRLKMYQLKSFLIRLNPTLYWKLDYFLRGRYFENEVALLDLLCDKNKTSIDVGSSFGAYLSYMHHHSNFCIGFEPNNSLALTLSQGFKNKNVAIHHCALSNVCKTDELRIPICHVGFSTIEPTNRFKGKIKFDEDIIKQKVTVKTLDFFNFSNIGFVKIDVEGHEIEVLKGAYQTLKTQKPNLLIEIEERHRKNSIKDVFKFLTDLDYCGYFLKNNKLIPIETFSIEKNQNTHNLKNYVRNFIFMTKVSEMKHHQVFQKNPLQLLKTA